MQLNYRIVNVFAVDGDPFSGNPLCVFEDGGGLSTEQMQALARQFNLSETTFLLPSARATSAVRIFTPDYEMPFAGHPTLGTAFVVASIGRAPASGPIVLDMPAGLIPVTFGDRHWTLQAQPPTVRSNDRDSAELAAALALESRDVLGPDGDARPLWVSTGVEQLVVPLASSDAVRRAQPVLQYLTNFRSAMGKQQVLIFAWLSATEVLARFFFESGAAVLEDPATGSACANLGGWCLYNHRPGPRRVTVSQGEAVQRPSRLQLTLDEQNRIFVSGRVVEIGRGQIAL